MKKASGFEEIRRALSGVLSDIFPDMRVAVAHSDRWNRPCVTFRWNGFEGLLPEERFHRLVGAIPADIREQRLAGFVWLELTNEESVDDFLRLPRSEDVAGREGGVHGRLQRAGIYESLAEALGPSPDKTCRRDFAEMLRIMGERDFTQEERRDAKLLMIRHHVFCDCQVLLSAKPELDRLTRSIR